MAQRWSGQCVEVTLVIVNSGGELMGNLDQLKAVTFDVFGTVVDWRSSIAREINLLADEKEVSIDGAEFASAWRLSLIHI